MIRVTLMSAVALLQSAWVLGADEAPQAPRLLISKDCALLVDAGKEARHFETLAELAKELAGLRGGFEVEAARPEPTSRGERIDARPGRKDRFIRISSGEIPAIELVRFLADYTGLPVINDSIDKSLAERTITVPAPIERATDALVKRLLEANHFRVTESASGAEGRVLVVESTDAPAGPDEPRARPIIVNGAEGAGRASVETKSSARRAKGPADGPVKSSGVVLEELPAVVRAQVDIPDGRGILVSEVDESVTRGTSDLSVLKRFDIITNVNDVIITSPAKLTTAINSIPAGAPFQIRVVRKGMTTILPARKKK